MNDTTVLHMLEETNAVMHGHFLLTSGLHSPTYVENSMYCSSPGTRKPCARKSPLGSSTTTWNWWWAL